MAHTHNHSHNQNEKNLKVAFFLNFGFAIIEAIGGYFTNSIAIMADSLHDIGDSITLLLSWRLEKISDRSGDERYSYGYKRYSLLGALIGSIILIGGAVVVVLESIKRIRDPQPTNAQGMLFLSLVGIAANGLAAVRAGKGKNLNSRIIYWHLLEDALGWAAVLVVSIILLFRDIPILDPILSIVITGFILFNVVRNLRQTITLFLQGVPSGIDVKKIENAVHGRQECKWNSPYPYLVARWGTPCLDQPCGIKSGNQKGRYPPNQRDLQKFSRRLSPWAHYN